MATATQVTIKVMVDGSQAGPAIDQINASLGEIGVTGTASLQKAGGEFDKLGGHINTNLDGVRLLSQEFGLRMPRALEAMASRMPAITTAINGMMGAFTAIAVAEIFYRIGEAIFKAFDIGGKQALEMAKAVRETDTTLRMMNDTLDVQILKIEEERSRLEKKPFQNGMKLALAEAAEEADQLSSKFDEIEANFKTDIVEKLGGTWYGRILNGKNDTEHEQGMMDDHMMNNALASSPAEINQENTRFGKALSGRLAFLQQQTEAYQKNHDAGVDYSAEIEALQKMIVLQEKEGKIIDGNIEKNSQQVALQKDQDAKSTQTSGQSAANKAREQREKVIEMQNDAVNAGLEGDARLAAEKQQSMDKLQREFAAQEITKQQLQAETAAVGLKFDNERDQRLKKQIDEAEKAVRDAQSAGLTGSAKVEAEHQARISDINASGASPQVEALRKKAEQIRYEQEMAQAVRESSDKRTQELQRAADERNRILDEEGQYGKQADEAERRMRGEGMQSWVADNRAALAAIQQQDSDETAKIKAQLASQKMSVEEYNQAKINIDRTANAQIQEQNQQAAQQIAGTLEDAFTNPMDFIKRRMQQMFMEIIANWIMQTKVFQSVFGSTMGSPGSPGAAAGTAAAPGAGGILGGIGSVIRGTFPGHPSATSSASSHPSIGSAIPGSGGMVMTAEGPVPTFDPTSPALQSHFAGAGGGSTPPGGSGGSSAGAGDSSSSVGVPSGIPGLLRRIPVSGGSGAGVPSIDGSGVALPGMSDGIPNISNGMPGPTGNGGGIGAGGSQGGSSSTASTAASAIGDVATVASEGYTGYKDTSAAYKSGSISGMVKGGLEDAAAGAAIGALFGPEGMLVGAAIGGLVGLTAGAVGLIMGEGGNLAAREYYRKTIFPQIEQVRTSQGGGDWQGAVSQINTAASAGMRHMISTWGYSAANWVNDNYLKKEQAFADGDVEAKAKGGAQYVSASANQFHGGGRVKGFGSFATSPTEGMIHAILGETVMNPSASEEHGSVLNAMQGGASSEDIARMYLGGGVGAGAARGGDTHHHYNISAVDARGFESLLRNGGARLIVKHTNSFASQYSGDGISG